MNELVQANSLPYLQGGVSDATSLGADEAEAADQALETLQNRVRTRFVPGGQAQMIFRIPKTPENKAYWDRMVAAQGRWAMEYCYCSVFDECWEVLGKWEQPKRVAACARVEENEFLP